MAMQLTRTSLGFIRVIRIVQKLLPHRVPIEFYYTTIDTMDPEANDMVQKTTNRDSKTSFDANNIRYFMGENIVNSSSNKENTIADLNEALANLMSKNKDKQLESLLLECSNMRIFINDSAVKKMFRHYSLNGKPDTIAVLQKYCEKTDPNLCRRNGEFMHYLAKAHCMKGNTEKGLSILLQSYGKFENLRNLYRTVLRELVQDSVLNRSEATLVILKKYILQFSNAWKDHYPLICFWHLCWSSSWFSDQMFANELLESSTTLQDIVRDKSTAFSIVILKYDFNEDAVVRLMQNLLKYKMMTEYTKVLQILFDYKLKNRDLRGCSEILKNCETLGISLPSNQQGKFINMIATTDFDGAKKSETKTFKLKF